MQIDRLRGAWDRFARLPFPAEADDQDISEWRFGLLEVDGFYAGIVQSLLDGGRPRVMPRRDELDDLADDLSHLRAATETDERVLQDCRTYFAALQDVDGALR